MNNPIYRVDIQNANPENYVPDSKLIQAWIEQCLSAEINKNATVGIRFVKEEEMLHLNTTYRHKPYVTNVLAFPSDIPPEVEPMFTILGDLAICPSIIAKEAKLQGITEDAHYAHMIIHGLLHLIGYTHDTSATQIVMETKEIQYLSQLGIANPYKE